MVMIWFEILGHKIESNSSEIFHDEIMWKKIQTFPVTD